MLRGLRQPTICVSMIVALAAPAAAGAITLEDNDHLARSAGDTRTAVTITDSTSATERAPAPPLLLASLQSPRLAADGVTRTSDRRDWQLRLAGAKRQRSLGYASLVGAAALALLGATSSGGNDALSGSENDKLGGSRLVILGCAAVVATFGVVQIVAGGSKVGRLEDEGRSKGYLGRVNPPNGTALALRIRF